MNMVLSYQKWETVDIDINNLPKKWQTFCKACLKDDDERSDKEWELVENYTMRDLLKAIGYKDVMDYGEIEIDDFY